MAYEFDAALADAVHSGRLASVAGILDHRELQLRQAGFPPQWPYAIHLLAHLHNYSLEDARFLYKRFPADIRIDPEVSASFQLLQRLWNKDYQGVWGVLSGFQWSPAATPLVAGLAGELRRRYVALIQRAYATLSAAKLASYLGVDQAEALQIAHGAGWQYTAGTDMIKVITPEIQHGSRAEPEHLQRLTEYVAHLESSAGAS